MGFLVALTGIERAKGQFGPVPLGLTRAFYVEFVPSRPRRMSHGRLASSLGRHLRRLFTLQIGFKTRSRPKEKTPGPTDVYAAKGRGQGAVYGAERSRTGFRARHVERRSTLCAVGRGTTDSWRKESVQQKTG